MNDDTPLRLDKAAALAFPDGSMKASGLRCEAAKGRLATMRIAGKTFTTLADIRRMIDLCRAKPSPQGSTSENVKGDSPNGSFSTEDGRSALARALNSASNLKGRSAITSPPSGKSSSGTIIPLRS